MPSRRISRVKRDQLRAAGKCFQCEETSHDQRNCPKLHSMRRPAMGVGSVVFVGMIGTTTGQDDAEGASNNPEATGPECRAYELCAMEWGDDERWQNAETRATSRYGIHQYDTGSGDLVEIFDMSQPGIGTLEVESSRFADPNFRLADVHALDANTDISCIREGGYRNRRDYKIWEWLALKWLKETLQGQILFESGNDSVSVWPALDGYCLHLDGTDVFYNIKHAEVLGDTFNPRRVLNQMQKMMSVDEANRPLIFRDSVLNRQQSILLGAVKLMVGVSQARKRAKRTEGVIPVERTAM